MVKSPKHLAYLLDCKLIKLQELSESVAKYYYESKTPKRTIDGSIKLIDGVEQYRKLYPSTGLLKSIQGNIVRNILSRYNLPICAMGGVQGRDNVSNAAIHKNNKFRFKTDIQNCFQSITNQMVFKIFIKCHFSPTVARYLTKLTTYKNHLPIGAPTSTYLANWVWAEYDNELLKICKERGITYTRTIDDLVFSSKEDFKSFTPELINVIKKTGLKISKSKTYYKVGSMEVTGIILTSDNKLDLHIEFKNKNQKCTFKSASNKWLSKLFEKSKIF